MRVIGIISEFNVIMTDRVIRALRVIAEELVDLVSMAVSSPDAGTSGMKSVCVGVCVCVREKREICKSKPIHIACGLSSPNGPKQPYSSTTLTVI